MPSESKFPGYKQEFPTYQAVKNLWRLAGEQDSCFQASQISISFLENFISTYQLNRSDFVNKLSELFHISRGHDDWETTKRIMARSYIVQTYNIQEIFFKEFNSEYRKFKNISEWITTRKEGNSNKNLDPFAQLIYNVSTETSEKFKGAPEAKLIEYYRLVRNAVVHSPKNGFEKPAEYFDVNIRPIISHFEGYFKFKLGKHYPAPNSPQNINHYDFSIYSRSLRYLSYLISDACTLSVQEIFDVEINDEDFRKSMTFYNYIADPNLKNKLINKLRGHFRSHYSKNVNDVEEFCSKYFLWYENQGGKKKKRSNS